MTYSDTAIGQQVTVCCLCQYVCMCVVIMLLMCVLWVCVIQVLVLQSC